MVVVTYVIVYFSHINIVQCYDDVKIDSYRKENQTDIFEIN